MNQSPVPILKFTDFISADGETLTTTSVHVALVRGKPHDQVLRDIQALIEQSPVDFSTRNFRPAIFLNSQGESCVSYTLTRDGFTLLAMQSDGKKAVICNVAFFTAFDAMAAYAKNQREGLRYRFMAKKPKDKDSGESAALAIAG